MKISFDSLYDHNENIINMNDFRHLVGKTCDDMLIQGLTIKYPTWDIAMAALIFDYSQ